jgi:hypothetical protein
VASWGIFLDHIPNNVVNSVTTRNYGFSDAADLFIFISGYTVAFVFARMMLERRFIIGASRPSEACLADLCRHVFLFVLYLAEIGYLAQTVEAIFLCSMISRASTAHRDGRKY